MDPAAYLLLARRRALTRPGWAGSARLARQRLTGQERRDPHANTPLAKALQSISPVSSCPAAALWVFEHPLFSIRSRDQQTPATSRCATADMAHASAGTTPPGSLARPAPPGARTRRRRPHPGHDHAVAAGREAPGRSGQMGQGSTL